MKGIMPKYDTLRSTPLVPLKAPFRVNVLSVALQLRNLHQSPLKLTKLPTVFIIQSSVPMLFINYWSFPRYSADD